jgi:hypothetical protein
MTDSVLAFTPVDFDIEQLPPDAPAGAWQAVAMTKIAKTSKDSFPMLIVDWELESAYEDENEQFIGARVSDFLVFFPEGHKASKMGKIRIRGLCDKLGIARSLIPTHIATSDDLAEFQAAIDGQKTDIWTAIEKSKDKQSGEEMTRTVVKYRAPGAQAAALPSLAADAEDEDEIDELEADEEQAELEAQAAAALAAKSAKSGTKNGAAKGGKAARR